MTPPDRRGHTHRQKQGRVRLPNPKDRANKTMSLPEASSRIGGVSQQQNNEEIRKDQQKQKTKTGWFRPSSVVG